MGDVGVSGLEDPGFPALGGGLALSRRTTSEIACPKAMVGRVIGKQGETIKALQTYTGALIQIDQSTEPTRVTVSGNVQSLSLAVSMISDICKGTFKGFALLRQLTQQQRGITSLGTPSLVQPRPAYAPGYGLIPPSQLQTGTGQYVPQAGAAMAQSVTPSQVILQGLPNMPGVRPLGQPGMTLGGMPQLAMPQVFNPLQQMQAQQFSTQLYYQPQDFSGAAQSELLYQQQESMMFGGGGGGPAAGGAKLMQQQQAGPAGMRPRPLAGWVPKMDLGGGMGQAAMGELLGNSTNQQQAGSHAMHGGAGHKGLVQVVDQEGKVQFYYQD